MFMRKVLCISLLFLSLSCSRENPSEVVSQQPQEVGGVSYSLEITPINVTRNSTLYLAPHGFTASDARIEWLVNGSPVMSSTPSEFRTTETIKKDKVQVKAIIEGKEILSNMVQIQNSPPEISKIKILPEIFKPGDALSVEASGSDADGDEVTLTYEWTKNGEPSGNSKQINALLRKGDKVDIKITPYDGEAYGRTVILHREIGNLPPVITENIKHDFDGISYAYQVKAADPDGDPLTYSLKSAPSGMTIDPSTGSIKWTVPADFKGKASLTVSVTDGRGGEAVQTLTIEIKPGQQK